MKKALAKLQKMELKKRFAHSRARAMAKQAAVEQQHLLASGGSGFGLGFAESKGFQLPTFGGVDPVALYGVATAVGSFWVKNRQLKQILFGLTSGLAGIAGYKAGKYGFQSLLNYAPPAALPAPSQTAGLPRPTRQSATGAYGEELVETGAF